MTTAFVLGGARNLGAMQVGMLSGLVGAGVVPDLVVGCSVGAINGAAVAAEPTAEGVRRLEALWLEVDRRSLWPAGPAGSALGLLRRGVSVQGNEGLRRVVDRYLGGPRRIEDLALPFACVATSLATGRERWFDSGPVADAVLASAALPGLLPPVEVDGEALVDGAAVNVVPMAKAVELGATTLYVLQVKDLAAPEPPPRRPLDVLLRTFAIARNARFVHELAHPPEGVDVRLLPVVPWPRRYDGFGRTAELVAAARAATEAWVASPG